MKKDENSGSLNDCYKCSMKQPQDDDDRLQLLNEGPDNEEE